jgi:hypothetical protein
VETVLNWDAFNRTPSGHLDTLHPGLELDGENWNSIDSLTLDMSNSNFSIIMTQAPEGCCGLFNWADLMEVLGKGITGVDFSLDQVDLSSRQHPFQLMNFGPSCLKGTNYLKTLLWCDYFMKMMSQGTEVGILNDFGFIDAFDGFLALLPLKIQEAVKPLFLREKSESSDTTDTDGGSLFRFWIEPGDLPYDVEIEEDGKITLNFGKAPMIIKCRRMKYNSSGLAVDDETYIQAEGYYDPASEFASAFTKHYNTIGEHIPVFARLQQYISMGCISKVLRSIAARGTQSEYIKDYINSNSSSSFRIDEFRAALSLNGIYSGPELNLSYHNHGSECSWVPSVFTYTFLTTSKHYSWGTSTTTCRSWSYGGVRIRSNMTKTNKPPPSKDGKGSSGSGKGGGGKGGGGGKDDGGERHK